MTDPAERRRDPPPPARLTVESLAFGGEGVARLDGKVRFVPGALPGEEVEAIPLARKRRYDRMKLLRVLKASEDRRLPLSSEGTAGLAGNRCRKPEGALCRRGSTPLPSATTLWA